MLKKIVIGLWFVAFILLFLYSFTQVDLGLTLTRTSVLLAAQKSFQYIGWFNRPISTYLYSALITVLLLLYLWTLWLVWKKKIQTKVIVTLTILGSVILLLSYNAFSYDLFNYIFDARIVTHYNQNPYVQKALDYPSDPMLGFMHWTHRTYPYGPLWLGLTVPLSYLGLGYFLLTFYIFKSLMVAGYLLSCWCIYKIAKKTKLAPPNFALAFFALNPFVLIESLVSAHIDIVMIAVCLLGVYFLFAQKKFTAWGFLIGSILIKFATFLLIPLFLWFPFSKRHNKDFLFFLGCMLLMIIGVYLQANRTTFQPWYFLLVVPFAAVISHKSYILIPAVLFSFLVLFQYVPYFYTGNFNPPIPSIMNQMLLWSVVASFVAPIVWVAIRKIRK